MSRSPQPVRRRRARNRLPAVVVVVVLLRAIVFMSVVSVAIVLLGRGYDASTVASFIAVVIATAATASARLTRGALASSVNG
jgi:uncharacterized ion transporter superfamily protein YfcC